MLLFIEINKILNRKGGRVGKVDVEELAKTAVERASMLCKAYYLIDKVPHVEIIASSNIDKQPFIYVKSHLEHIVSSWKK